MEKLTKQPLSDQLVEEYRVSQKKLEKINQSLKPFTKEHIQKALKNAEKERESA